MLHVLIKHLLRFIYTRESILQFYIINLPSIIGIQFIDGAGENIVKMYRIEQTLNM